MSVKTRTSAIVGGLMAAALGLTPLGAVPARQAPAPAAATKPKPKPKSKPWWAHAVIYEIYPRSFQDTNGDGIGDLKGITRRLDYIKGLGVDAIWITPFFPSPNKDFGYDVADYTDVAPEYGTMADWDELAREAKKRGIRILVDFVLNHTSDQHPWFLAARSSRDNPKRNWYVWHDPAPDGGPPTNWQSIFGGSTWAYDKASNQYFYHIFLPQQPDVNWANPGLRKAMFDVVRFWLDHGASGFRLDATPYLFEDEAWPQDPDVKAGLPVHLKPYNAGLPANHAVLRELRAIIDGYPGDRILLGENAVAKIDDLVKVYGAGDEINLPMNFLYTGVKTLDAQAFKARIDEAETRLNGFPPVYHFSNHDTPRQWTRFGDGKNDARIARITAALSLTLSGTALMYYGEEIGMADLTPDELKGFPLGPKRVVADHRDALRSPMQWTSAADAGFSTGSPWLPVAKATATTNVAAQLGNRDSLYHWYARLLGLRKSEPALREGTYVPLDSGNPKVLAYARQDRAGHGVLMLFNMSAAPQTATVSGWSGKILRGQGVIMASPATSDGALARPMLEPYAARLIRYTAG